MSEKEKALADAIRMLVNAGYEIMYETAPIGKAGNGIHLHLIDELEGEQK